MKDLLHRARLGDGDAFAALFQEHVPMLWKMAASLLSDENAAADALQECAIKAWRACPGFKAECALSTWLARILLNVCYDELRLRSKVIPFSAISGEGVAVSEGLVEGSASDTADERISRLDIEAAIARLSTNDRLVLTLFYVSDLPTAQIADVLGVSDGAVRTRLARARARFKEAYVAAENAACNDDETLVEVAI